jgi:hypothetical protein
MSPFSRKNVYGDELQIKQKSKIEMDSAHNPEIAAQGHVRS